MPPLYVRTAESGDAAAIAATLREAFAVFEPLYTPAAFLATTPPVEQIRARLAEGPVWVAEREGEVVGTVSGIPRGDEVYIRSMAVRPIARGEGVGMSLLLVVEAHAREHGYRRLSLTTTQFLTAAAQLYKRAGFQVTGEQSDLFGTPLLAMVKRLW